MKSKFSWVALTMFCVGLLALFFAALLFTGENPEFLDSSDKLAVIEVVGPIFDSKDICQQLDRVYQDDRIKGLILRIDSPGGAVGPSQEIYDAVLRLKTKKKVIVSMGSVAASGGYYIAVAADKIVANPGTITGSIGVLMDHMNVEELLKFLKVDMEVLKAGALKDIGSPVRTMTPEEKDFLHSILNNMHGQFKEAVKKGRGLTQQQIDTLADGRVFTGEQALELGLIDKLGSQQAAVDLAQEMLHIKGTPKLLYPKKEKPKLMDLLAEGNVEATFLKMFYTMREGRALYLTKGIRYE